MTEYLVTGGAGFIGSNLVHALAARGARVRVLDDLSSGRAANLDGLGAAVELVTADVRDRAAVRRAVAGVRIVFHEAAIVSVPRSIEDPVTTDSVNVGGTLVLLEEARAAGVARVVLASSCAVYGENGGVPCREDSTGAFASPYALSKWTMEEHGRLFHRLHGTEVVVLRYFNVYGPRQAADSAYASVIPLFVRALLRGEPAPIHGDGEQTRDFVFVEDAVRANLLAAEAPGVAGMAFNVASGEARSVRALHDELAAIVGGAPPPRHGPPRPGDIRDSRADIGLARVRLGFEARVSFREGLARTIAWSRSEGAGGGGAR